MDSMDGNELVGSGFSFNNYDLGNENGMDPGRDRLVWLGWMK